MSEAPSDSLMQNVMATLLVLARTYRSAADKALASYGLSQATAWPVIMVGRLGGGIRQGALADAIGIEGSSLVRLIDQLVAAGLIERRGNPVDRRTRTLHLTEAGDALRTQVEDVLRAFRRNLLKDVAKDDLEACQRVFDSLTTTFGRDRATQIGPDPLQP